MMVQQASVLSDSAIVRQRSVFEDQVTHFLSKSLHGKDVVVSNCTLNTDLVKLFVI